MKVGIRRVYESPGSDEGFRILVDRVWPRDAEHNHAVVLADAFRKR